MRIDPRTGAMRRYLVFPFESDTRARFLEKPGERWDDGSKLRHLEKRARLIERLKWEFGPLDFDFKLENFRAAGTAPFSVVSYHNSHYHQVRYAFIHGFYYPALVAGCDLGDRILNDLIIELWEDYRTTPEHKELYWRNSINDWKRSIATLEAWGVMQRAHLVEEFRGLKKLRHNFLRFNDVSYDALRYNALSALKHLRSIIYGQFGFTAGQEWMIPGTRGACFVRKDCENQPFIKRFYLPECPFVGPYYAVESTAECTVLYDWASYDDRSLTDEEFADLFNARTPDLVVSPDDFQNEETVVVVRTMT